MGSSPIRVANFASVAQLVEQGTENPRVVGSIPTGGTIKALRVLRSAFLFYPKWYFCFIKYLPAKNVCVRDGLSAVIVVKHLFTNILLKVKNNHIDC